MIHGMMLSGTLDCSSHPQRCFVTAPPSPSVPGVQEFRRWIVETQLFLVVWQNVFDPYEASGFRHSLVLLAGTLCHILDGTLPLLYAHLV